MTVEWCVIFNPAAGRRRARRRLERWEDELRGRAEFRATEKPGHARELARQAAREGFKTVGAAGGDGTVHEVLNGLMEASVPGVRLGLLPIGSANDFAFSVDAGKPGNSAFRWIDVGRIRSANGGKAAFFGCGAGIGFNAWVTVEARRLPHLQGLALYGVAALRAIARHLHSPILEITLDEQSPWRTPTLLFSVLNGRREGSFPLAPQAEIDDGQFDFVHAGPLTRWQVLRLLPRVSLYGPPKEYPHIRQGRCRSVLIRAERPLIIHIDGEFFCLPEEEICDVEITVLPSALEIDLSMANH
jgi:diacylglycerol kinase (ATP)